MATTDEEDVTETPSGIIAKVGGKVYRVVEETVVPDARSRSLWPFALVLILGGLVPLIGLPWGVPACVALVSLAYWLGARA